MRKSGWAAAAGIVSAVLLLTACGGSSSSTNAGGGSTPTTGAASTNKPNPGSTSAMTSPPPGAVYFGVSHSEHGWVMAEGNGSIVYTYAGDSAGKPATCTGACAAQWPPVTGTGLTSLADHTLPGKFGVVGNQITYNGLPLYSYKGELPYQNHEGGQWKAVTLPQSLIISG